MNTRSVWIAGLLTCLGLQLGWSASDARAQAGAYAACVPIAASPAQHFSAGRATRDSAGRYLAKGSGQVLTGSSVTLAQSRKDYFEIRSSCPLPPGCTVRTDYGQRTRIDASAPGGVRVFPLDLECNLAVPTQGTRTYDMHVPVNYTNASNVPLVMEMHGGGGWAPRPLTQDTSGWQLVSNTAPEAFIVIYPIGSATAPNTTNKFAEEWQTCNYDDPSITCPAAGYPHDRKFLIEVVKHAVAGMKINKRQLYAVGLSSGAAMVQTLACKFSSLFAAVAPMAGGITAANQARARDNWNMTINCNPTRKLPQFYVHAYQDRVVPYAEGSASVAFWRSKLGCVLPDRVGPQSNLDPFDPSDSPGNDLSIVRTRTCASGSELAFAELDGSQFPEIFYGGHIAWWADDMHWPGAPASAPYLAQWAWDWMKRFSLPADPAWPPLPQ